MKFQNLKKNISSGILIGEETKKQTADAIKVAAVFFKVRRCTVARK